MAKATDTTTPMSEAQMDALAASTGEALATQPKRKIRLYQAPAGQQQLPDEVVCVNGYVYQIKRGVEVAVPETVYQILEQAGRL